MSSVRLFVERAGVQLHFFDGSDWPLAVPPAGILLRGANGTRGPFRLPQPPGCHSPRPSPAEIRAALVPAERSRFDREYRQALVVAAGTFSLGELEATLESWRRIAWIY